MATGHATQNGNSTNGNRKITFEANIPQVITLRFTGGKTVTSQFGGDQVLFTCQEGSLYATPALAQLIDQAGGAGDTIQITKRVRKIGATTHTDWNVERLNEPDRPDYPTPINDPFPEPDRTELDRAREHAARVDAASAAAAGRRQAEREAAERISQPAAAAAIEAPASAPHPNVLAQALMLAIDAAVVAEAHARRVGLSLAWRAEDIRAMAATMIIERRNPR